MKQHTRVTISSPTPNRIEVESPYDKGFIYAAKRAGGRWDSQRKVWAFTSYDVALNSARDSYRGRFGKDALVIRDLVAGRTELHNITEAELQPTEWPTDGEKFAAIESVSGWTGWSYSEIREWE